MPICAAARNDDMIIEFGFEGIEYASRMGAKVINCSWGRGGGFSRFEQDVINAAAAAGALLVVSAGNDTLNVDYVPQFPVSYRNVLAVGATLSTGDMLASFSNYGVCVPVYAPGTNILSAYTDGGYTISNNGTSFSSPLVAGLAGILVGQHPTWTPLQVAAQIRVTADSIDAVTGNGSLSGRLGRGRVNFARALSEVHAGLDVASFRMRTPAGKDVFIRGDSILLAVTLRNILPAPAQNLQIRLTSLDPEVQVLLGTASLSLLGPGQSAELPDFVCTVSSLASQARVVVLNLEWVSNGNERDAYAIRANVYPSLPTWVLQPSATSAYLSGVRAVSRKVVWAAGGDGSGSPSVVVRTMDGGDSWSDVSGNLPAAELSCVEAVDSSRAWVGTTTGKIFSTADGGRTWSEQSYSGVQSPFINGIRFFDQFKGLALGDPAGGGAQFVLLRTADGGTSWAHIASEPIGSIGEAGYMNSFVWVDTLHGWFGSSAGHVWRTTDGGKTWLNAPSGGTNSYSLSFGDEAHGVAIHENGILSRTADGGASWRVVSFPSSQSLDVAAFAPGTPSVWVGATTDIGRSHDAGASWDLQVSYPISGRVTAMSFSDTLNGWAATSNGEVLRYSPAVANNDSGPYPLPVPHEFGLDQNYPNPFNGTTRIRFQIVRPSHVQMTLYDLLGRRVRTLVDGDFTAATHEIQFSPDGRSSSAGDGMRLSSGLYFYRLTVTSADGGILFRNTRKMILIR
jgi:photosystem II stability/assembly factor-like uncharacterized protein